MAPKLGDIVEIVAPDHSTKDLTWTSPSTMKSVDGLTLSVVGYFVSESKTSYTLAMGQCEGDYTTFWFAPKNKKTKIKVIRRGKR